MLLTPYPIGHKMELVFSEVRMLSAEKLPERREKDTI